MRRLLSIFNFDTLERAGRFSAAWALAGFLVLSVNVAVFFADRQKLLFSGMPLRMVEDFFDQTREPYRIWFVGNSLLGRSVDMEKLQERYGDQFLRRQLGSASFEALATISGIALKQSPAPPQDIYLFVSKDDFNANGLRSKRSQAYLGAALNPTLTDRILTWFPLYADRSSILDAGKKFLTGSKAPPPAEADPADESQTTFSPEEESRFVAKHIDGEYLASAGADYAFADEGFEALGEAAKARDAQVFIVFPPVSRAPLYWQQRYAPDQSWPEIKQRIVELSETNGFKVLDYENVVPTADRYFDDPYHLSRAGRAIFMPHFLKTMSENLQE